MNIHPSPFSCRDWLRTASAGFGYMAFAGLAAQSTARANANSPKNAPSRPS
jgi:hypothetical protein